MAKHKPAPALFWKIMRLSFESLRSSALRAFLTMLGIVIGGATIILVVEMGQGAKDDIDQQFSNMSVTTILVNAPSTSGSKSKLDQNDAVAIQALSTINYAVPQLAGSVSVVGGTSSGSYSVLGTTPDIFAMMNTSFVRGEAFSQQDDIEHARVAVVGANIIEEFFGSRDAKVIGEELVLGKKSFTIVGTLAYKGGSSGPTTIDDTIFTPYSSAYRYVLGSKGKFTINATAIDVESVSQALLDISAILRENHNLRPGSVDDFRLRDMGTNVQAAKDSARTMSLLLGSVGAVVLIVGGIGIMNIMYVTVTERTKEIGLRKAIGAKDHHIETQFLLEAVILSFFGYFIGAILATILYLLLLQLSISITFVWWSYFLSAIFVGFTGVFFGYAPAKKAASMNPIEALRYE